jgi:hypothetical protein
VLRPLTRIVLTLSLGVVGNPGSLAQGPALSGQAKFDETRLTKLSSTVHPLARPENDRGAVSDSFPAERMLVLLNPPADHKQALEQFLRDVHMPGSPSYHKWIGPEEFGARFGARDEDVQQLQSWLQSHGFSVARLPKGRHFLEFSGTAAQVREALHTEIHQYEIEGNLYYSVATEVSIPESIAPLIRGFAPLNTFPLASYVHTAGKGTLSPTTKRMQPEFTTTTASGKTFYALVPEDFATQYNLSPLYQAGTTGAGTTIGIIGGLNLNLSTVDSFRKLFGLPGNNTQVVIDGEDPGVGLSPNVEGFLDVEVSGAVAPKATVNYYIAGGSHFQSSIVLAAMRAIEDNQADVLSASFGECEQLLGPSGNLLWATMWEQAAAQGQTVFVSSGDSGPTTCPLAVGVPGGTLQYLGPSVNGLASTPWNVAVGGTDFFYSDYASGGASISTLWNSTNDANLGSLKATLPEQPWDEDLGLNITPFNTQSFTIPSGAGGGGPSSCSQLAPPTVPPGIPVCQAGYRKPSWQNAPGVPADGARDLPDVSLFAAAGKNLTAYAICVEPGDCAPVTTGDPQVFLVGGTSASSPAMAGIMALVNQKFGRQGQANFTLYALANQHPAVFHDITMGNNDILCVPQQPHCIVPVPNLPTNLAESFGLYLASPGYDLATGIGSLDASALLANWNKVTFLPTTTTLQLSPTSLVHGAAVSIATTVAPTSGSAIPTGDVNIRTTSPQPLRVDCVTLAPNGSGTTNWSFFPGGTYQVAAQYAGDGTFASSTSSPSTLTVTPEPSTTALTLRYAYLSPTSGLLATQTSGTVPNGGQAPFSSIWTFQAGPSGQVPQAISDATGTATFIDGSTSTTVPLNSQGLAVWSPQVLALGPHSVTVQYSGDASYSASTSSALSFTVTKGIPWLTAALEARPVSLSQNTPPTYLAGSTAIVHILLRSLDSFVPPTGSVTVNFGALTQTAPLGAENFSNQGLSALNFTFPNIRAGSYALGVSYVGDSNWNAATFTGATYTFAAATASATTTSLSLTPSNVDSSGSVRFSVTVSATQSPSPTPIGFVNLSANGTSFANLLLVPTQPNTSLSTGSVTVPGTALPSGALQIMAIYQGNLGLAPSSSSPVPLTVTFTDFTMSPGASRVLVKSGQSASVPLLLGGPNGGSTAVSFACLPSSASFGCSVSPSSQTVTGATTASVTINAFIPGAQASAKLEGIGERRSLLAAGAGFALAFFLVFASPRRALRRALLLSFALLTLGTLVAGCGSNSTPPPPPPPPPNVNAPPGTYTVVVAGTSGGISHNAKITVVIQ